MIKIGFSKFQILKQSVAAFLAITLLFISGFAPIEQEVKKANSTEYFTSLDSNFSDSFQGIQPKLRVISSGQVKLQLISTFEANFKVTNTLVYRNQSILPQVLGIQPDLLSIIKFVICTNAP